MDLIFVLLTYFYSDFVINIYGEIRVTNLRSCYVDLAFYFLTYFYSDFVIKIYGEIRVTNVR